MRCTGLSRSVSGSSATRAMEAASSAIKASNSKPQHPWSLGTTHPPPPACTVTLTTGIDRRHNYE
jgi:hypothetical protein